MCSPPKPGASCACAHTKFPLIHVTQKILARHISLTNTIIICFLKLFSLKNTFTYFCQYFKKYSGFCVITLANFSKLSSMRSTALCLDAPKPTIWLFVKKKNQIFKTFPSYTAHASSHWLCKQSFVKETENELVSISM